MAIKSYLDAEGLTFFRSLLVSTTITEDNSNSTVNAPSISAIMSWIEDNIATEIDDLQSSLNNKSNSTHSHEVASSSTNGFMSSSDKNKLNGISESADSVSFSTILTSGEAIGIITINNVDTTIYSPIFTDTNTTYSFSEGTTENGTFEVTPSNGTTQTVSIKGLDTAAYHPDNYFALRNHGTHVTNETAVTSIKIKSGSETATSLSSKTSGDIIVGNVVSYNIETTLANDNNIPTGSAVTAAISGKQDTVKLTENKVVISNNNGYLTASTISSTELGYLSGVESSIQNQLDSKSPNVGNTSLTTVGIVSTGTWNATAISTTKGGTGLTSISKGSILYGSTTNTISELKSSTNGSVLKLSNGVPIWSSDIDTWKQNTTSSEGYVSAASTANRVWATTSSGNPTWSQVTNNMLSGSIANDKLLYDSITIGNTTISLGSTVSLQDLSVVSTSDFTTYKNSVTTALNSKVNTSSVESTISSTTSSNIPTSEAVASYVNSTLAAADALRYKGTLGTGGTVTSLPSRHTTGDTYKVIEAGKYANVDCEIGDMIICLTDGTSSDNSHWTVVQTNIDGAVIGPDSSENNSIVIFNGTTGKSINSSEITISGGSINGDLNGTATSATNATYASKIGSTTSHPSIGSATQPVYVDSNGTVTKGSTYAGGTKVKLNNSDLGTQTAIFYAPTSGGTNNYILKSNGTTSTPTWVMQSSLSVGSANTATTASNYSNNGSIKEALDSKATKYHTHSFTPSGTVSKPSFTGINATISSSVSIAGLSFTGTSTTLESSYTPSGTISTPVFKGTSTTIKPTVTATGTFTGTGVRLVFTGTSTTLESSCIPFGSVSSSTTIVYNTTTVNSITSVGTLPSLSMTYTTSTKNLNISFSTGSLPSKGSNTTVVTGSKSISTSSTFSGTTTDISINYTPSGYISTTSSGTVNYRPSGSISITPTVTGVSYTPSGTISTPKFYGEEDNAIVVYTPSGSVSYTSASGTANYTPSGTVSQPSFTGTTQQNTSEENS